MKSWMTVKKGHFEAKTRSLGQILEKPCIRSKGYNFSPKIMIPSKKVCLDEVSDKFEK